MIQYVIGGLVLAGGAIYVYYRHMAGKQEQEDLQTELEQEKKDLALTCNNCGELAYPILHSAQQEVAFRVSFLGARLCLAFDIRPAGYSRTDARTSPSNHPRPESPLASSAPRANRVVPLRVGLVVAQIQPLQLFPADFLLLAIDVFVEASLHFQPG